MSDDVLRDLARAKAVFQLRAIEAVIRGPAIAAAAREGGDAKQAPGNAPQSGAASASPDPRRIA